MFFLLIVFSSYFFFFFNDTATTEIYTLSLHDALPIYPDPPPLRHRGLRPQGHGGEGDRKSTRLNSSHRCISYAVFCLKKKKKKQQRNTEQYKYETKRIHMIKTDKS